LARCKSSPNKRNEVLSKAGLEERRKARASYTGDSSPGSVVPFSGAVSDDGAGSGVRNEDAAADDDEDDDDEEAAPHGRMRMNGAAAELGQFGNLSRRDVREAKLRRNAQRLERRFRRMGMGPKGGKRRSNTRKERGGIDRSNFVSNVLLRARLAKPCSYCHVPYHHRQAPFQNMKLVPW